MRAVWSSIVTLALLSPHRVVAKEAVNGWVAETSSPSPGTPLDPKDKALLAACGGGVDAKLVEVARGLAESLASKGELPDAQEIEWRQRRAGNPHVWAKTWGARATTNGNLDREALSKDVAKWLGGSAKRVRCGAASHRIGSGTSSKEAVAVIAIDPVADLAPLPTQTKLGTWIDVDATLLRGTDARVVVLPPVGAPKTILSSSTSASPPHVRARFAASKPGRWVVQVLADVGAGPRPVLEAEVFAGVEPPSAPPSPSVPGEEAGDTIDDAEAALAARLVGARAAEKLPPLARDPLLDKVARAHAEAMKKAKLLGHDVGDGDPATRVTEAGGAFKLVGENVAKAKSERAAHRALYASPSHRANMLDGRFKKVGIAIARDPITGDLWVAQLYGG